MVLLTVERERIVRLLEKLEEARREGRVSEETYREMKARYEAMLAEAAGGEAAPPRPPRARPPSGRWRAVAGLAAVIAGVLILAASLYWGGILGAPPGEQA
ncbi:MAG: hypothetical protein DRO06_02845, partial [Thermoproteota archaeon]